MRETAGFRIMVNADKIAVKATFLESIKPQVLIHAFEYLTSSNLGWKCCENAVSG